MLISAAPSIGNKVISRYPFRYLSDIGCSDDGYTCILQTADGGFDAALYLYNVN